MVISLTLQIVLHESCLNNIRVPVALQIRRLRRPGRIDVSSAEKAARGLYHCVHLTWKGMATSLGIRKRQR